MNNYRDITLTSVLQKLLEKIMYRRKVKRCSKIEFPHKFQQGFRPQCGSITAAFTVKESICHYLERNAVFLDNAKALNSVWIQGLQYMVYKLGFNGNFLKILNDSFHGVTAYELYNGQKSKEYPIEQGAGQGRTLTAWLFLVMINGLATKFEVSGLGLSIKNLHIPCDFLADLLLATSIRNLQLQLDIVHGYANTWRLNCNSSKSLLMQFTCRKLPPKEPEVQCYIGNTPIFWETSKVYMGITLCSILKLDNDMLIRAERGVQLLIAL
ncbi:uncharacterized protein LOC132548615 [Ylistrum balloti]|uniref:uncharacterized protein LOC132548615 n=1 Tax=Ylistrum balloti TaxID=509963 RepID=UPI002905E8BE|nr:uncharacterized protein LOC132548615 [Ylistrum balloti]